MQGTHYKNDSPGGVPVVFSSNSNGSVKEFLLCLSVSFRKSHPTLLTGVSTAAVPIIIAGDMNATPFSSSCESAY